MKKYKINKKSFYIILLLMFLGGVFGYIYEVIFYRIDTGHFINRGTTYGPWIPIYAFGSLFILLTTYKFKNKPLVVFLLSTIVSGLLEFITGYLLFHIEGIRLWDYNTEILNFGNIGGYICLRSVLFFGLSGLFLMYILIPLLKKLSSSISERKLAIISITLFSMFFIDFIITSILPRIF